MENTNFAGKDGFVWWVGEVENRVDPLAMGRCQIRIFGWHSTNKLRVPTESLPWAHPLYPINGSKTFSAPQIGDWILGFFLDGENAQQPVMMGFLPGIKKQFTTSAISSLVSSYEPAVELADPTQEALSILQDEKDAEEALIASLRTNLETAETTEEQESIRQEIADREQRVESLASQIAEEENTLAATQLIENQNLAEVDTQIESYEKDLGNLVT